MAKGRSDAAKVGPGEYENVDASVDTLRQYFLAQVRADVPQALEELRDTGEAGSLLGWATRWGFNQDAWLMTIAQRTLTFWRDNPVAGRVLLWADVIESGEFVPEPEPISWAPTIETKRQFEQRVKQYIADVERWATSQGLEPTLSKANLGRDLAALVQYQVKGDDLTAVADEWFGSDANDDAARKAIAAMANILGVTIRK